MTRLAAFLTLALLPLLAARAEPAMSSPASLDAGHRAPDFSALGDDGKTYSLSELAGRYVILYFYPKDDTPGCTVEAKGFRDDAKAYEAKGAVVLGVSLDDAESHQAFRKEYGLNFPLLVDGKELAKKYGVPVRFGYASRQTFVIGKDGVLIKVFRQVTPDGHSKEILSLLQ